MKHPLDRAKTGPDTGLSRVIAMKKDALPHAASLALQKRERPDASGKRAAEFLRIARQESR